jgi:glycosyltransferase involved in cell wall biosynthesis
MKGIASSAMDAQVPRTGSPGMRILFASLDVPFPVTSGRRLRNWALLEALAQQGHVVTMVCFDEPAAINGIPTELNRVCRNVDVICHPDAQYRPTSVHWQRIRALPSALPYGAWRLRSGEFKQKLRQRLSDEPFDALICDDIYVAPNIPSNSRVPIILNKHGIGSVVLERYLSNEPNPVKRAYGRIELGKTRRWEASICRKSELIMACSGEDRQQIRMLCPGATVAIVPNVIDIDQYAPAPLGDTRTVVFAAYMGWYPNQDAARFFGTSVFPLVREFVPEARFLIAGRDAPDALRDELSKISGVEFTGTVPDMRPVISGAAVAVVPLRIATGTRLKILEAAALEKAVVSTRIGAEGFDFIHGEEIILADTAEAMAREIAALLLHPDRGRDMGVRARRRVEREYSMTALHSAVYETISLIAGKLRR